MPAQQNKPLTGERIDLLLEKFRENPIKTGSDSLAQQALEDLREARNDKSRLFALVQSAGGVDSHQFKRAREIMGFVD